mmetsp:Transcript_48208/g.138714  ORF Transcript_48208/g.138714 Transcript_48208/m.138714 type:complete len:285 (-) Transcript_48208:189-1043(-)
MTRPLVVLALAVHPQHVRAAPITEHGRHPALERFCELHVAFVPLDLDADIALAIELRDGHLHGPEVTLRVGRELRRHLKRLFCVDTPRPWPELLGCEVPWAVPRRASAVAASDAGVVIQGVQRGVEGVLIRLHDVYFVAGDATHVIRVAVVVETRRLPGVLLHRDQVESGVATTTSAHQISHELKPLIQQVQANVLAMIIAARATICKVGSAVHVWDQQLPICDLHAADPRTLRSAAPPGWDDRHSPVAIQLHRARALLGRTLVERWCRGDWRRKRRRCRRRLW